MRIIKLLLLLIIFQISACQSNLPSSKKLEDKSKQGTSLIDAIKQRNRSLALDLIDQNYDLNLVDSCGQSALHWAAKRSMRKVASALLKNTVHINAKDSSGYSAFDYARKTFSPELIRLFLENGANAFSKEEKSFYDGPFVDLRPDGNYAYYLKNDGKNQIVGIDGKYLSDTCTNFKGWMGENQEYAIRNSLIPSNKISTDQPIIVLGDIHGEYDRMINILKENKVINDDLNWIFGKGNLVYVGDVFDRGEQVTEILWFIYRLEQEATKNGGMVHFVFGNHELMILNNDVRYIADKYEDLCEPLSINYSSLFHPNSVLGEWLRTRNSIIQINDILFVHAGISDHFVHDNCSVENVNHLTRQYLLAGTNKNNYKQCKKILSSTGPFWYRGYFKESKKYKKIKEKDLNDVLDYLNVKTIIVGHTEVDHVSEFFHGKIIDVNLPLRDKEVPNQALLIENGEFKVHSGNGTINQLK